MAMHFTYIAGWWTLVSIKNGQQEWQKFMSSVPKQFYIKKGENKMEKGEIVEIYQDPYSKKIYEGKAKLIEKRYERWYGDKKGEVWRVKFLHESDSDPDVLRFILE